MQASCYICYSNSLKYKSGRSMSERALAYMDFFVTVKNYVCIISYVVIMLKSSHDIIHFVCQPFGSGNGLILLQ